MHSDGRMVVWLKGVPSPQERQAERRQPPLPLARGRKGFSSLTCHSSAPHTSPGLCSGPGLHSVTRLHRHRLATRWVRWDSLVVGSSALWSARFNVRLCRSAAGDLSFKSCDFSDAAICHL